MMGFGRSWGEPHGEPEWYARLLESAEKADALSAAVGAFGEHGSTKNYFAVLEAREEYEAAKDRTREALARVRL